MARHVISSAAAIILVGLYVSGFFLSTTYKRDRTAWADYNLRLFPSTVAMRLWAPMRFYDRWRNPGTIWVVK